MCFNYFIKLITLCPMCIFVKSNPLSNCPMFVALTCSNSRLCWRIDTDSCLKSNLFMGKKKNVLALNMAKNPYFFWLKSLKSYVFWVNHHRTHTQRALGDRASEQYVPAQCLRRKCCRCGACPMRNQREVHSVIVLMIKVILL